MAVKRLFSLVWLSGLILLGSARASSLYPADNFQSITADSLALRVGDSVTVLIVENSTATSSTGDELERGLGASGSLQLTNSSESGRLGLGLDANGTDSTNRSGNLRAVVTADVTAVDDVGRLFITGRQVIVVNGEEQLISLSGWARPDHIDATNRITSSRLSQARIEYSGVDDADDQGFLNSLWDWFSSAAGAKEEAPI